MLRCHKIVFPWKKFFFLRSFIGVSITSDKKQSFVFGLFFLLVLYYPPSLSLFCQLKLVIKLLEQSSFVFVCCAEKKNPFEIAYQHLYTHMHQLHRDKYWVSRSRVFFHAHLIIQCRHIILALTLMMKTIRWDLKENGKKKFKFFFFFFFSSRLYFFFSLSCALSLHLFSFS